MEKYRITYRFATQPRKVMNCNALGMEDVRKFVAENWPEDAIFAEVERWVLSLTMDEKEAKNIRNGKPER